MIKKIFLFALFVLLNVAHAETYKIYLGSPAGGPSDVYVRKIADEVEKISDTKFVVINRPGADFLVAYQAMLEESKTNPNVLFVSSTGTQVSSYLQHPALKLDPLNDTKSLIMFVRINFLFAALKESNINSLDDLKGNLNIGYSGATAPLLISKMKLEPSVQTVPFRNDAELMLGLLRKDVPVAQIVSTNNLITVHKDKIKIIGNLDKMGIVAGQGISVAKNFPDDKLIKLNRLFNQVLSQPSMIEWFASTVNTKPVGGSPADYDRLLAEFKRNILDR
jgi:tripartite-type tricarboxylate transporter receptor subunit TctC